MGFHGNQIVRKMVEDMIKKLNVSSFIETGTHTGDTTIYMAWHFILPIFSCDISKEYYDLSTNRLAPFKHVKLSLESSEKFIERLINENVLGNFPMFFLDAHWHDYWPLQDEVRNIMKLNNFIILVDDFSVPGQPQFESDAGGGGTIGIHRAQADIRPCSIELFKQYLTSDCEIGYPNYNKTAAYGTPNTPHLRGHAFIVRGAPQEFNEIKINKYYFWNKI